MRLLIVLFLFLAVSLPVAPAQSGNKQARGDVPKVIPGFDPAALDTQASPCVDFYQYACGGWMAKNPIPPDQPAWGRFNELAERNREVLHQILEDAAAKTGTRSAVEQKIGDYYSACMDEKALEAKGLSPLQAELDRIAALPNKQALVGEIVRLHRLGVSALFNFGSGQDFKNSSQMIAQADQGGLGLPDRDYYFKEDPKSVETRRQYVAHVQNMFRLLGDAPDQAATNAQVVMRIETALAKGSLDNVSRRDPAKIYHKMRVQQLTELAPSFAWKRYLVGIGAPPIESLNVVVTDFFKQMDQTLKAEDLAHWKTYLRWHLAHAAAPFLPSAFVNETFDFYSRKLQGQKELRARWKRCVSYTDAALGEALGQSYVERTFGAEGKQRTLGMVQALEKALERDIKDLPWMTDATKKQALVKLAAIANKIGYPDRWRDYTALKIVRDDALGNAQRAADFEVKRQLSKIGKPVDKNEWQMTPPTVNAYYNPLMNNINFPAGILQPPFFDKRLDDAVNFGAIGAVIGHELTHGFDDEGRQFDAQGNLRDWWTPEDAKAFEERAACFVEEYSSFMVVKDPPHDVKLNGKLTLGENTADNGGLRIAYMALMDTLAGRPADKMDGFTPDQRLFLGWGQIWCENVSEPYQRLLAQVDPHSPGRYRVNGVVSNMPEFQKAFACQPSQPMVREKPCRVW